MPCHSPSGRSMSWAAKSGVAMTVLQSRVMASFSSSILFCSRSIPDIDHFPCWDDVGDLAPSSVLFTKDLELDPVLIHLITEPLDRPIVGRIELATELEA